MTSGWRQSRIAGPESADSCWAPEREGQHGQTSDARLAVAQASGGGEIDAVVVHPIVDVI